jgi:hypothetical protein
MIELGAMCCVRSYVGGLVRRFMIIYDTDDSTILRGSIIDQAALHGLLIRVRDLSLTLLSVNQVAPDDTPLHDQGT